MVDPMHNLLLGTAKKMLTIWKNSGLLSNTMFDQIQHEVDSINLPAGIGWVPGKIAAFFQTLLQNNGKRGQSYFPAIFSKINYLYNISSMVSIC